MPFLTCKLCGAKCQYTTCSCVCGYDKRGYCKTCAANNPIKNTNAQKSKPAPNPTVKAENRTVEVQRRYYLRPKGSVGTS